MKKKNNINKIISIITLILSIFLLILLAILNLVPSKIYLPVLVVILVLNFVNVFFAFKIKLKKKSRIIQISLSVIMSLISIIGSFYLLKTISFINSIESDGYVTENYSVLVLKESSYEKLEDLKDKSIGILKNDNNESKVIDYLNSKLSFILEENTDILNLKESLYSNELEAITLEDAYIALLEEVDEEFKDAVKVVYTFSLKYETEDIAKDVNVTSEPFAVYISGIDTYGNISSVSRSDVNILAIANPKTYQVLLISIPRDYYVQLHGTTGYKDKLTHAGIYGINTSVQTIEDLLNIDINYYVKVNFTSLIDIVNALDGIEVYSEYSFDSEVGYYFYKGYNRMNGNQALAFARARHAFVDGDRTRGKNQQAVIEAIVRKASSKAIITKYDSLLNALSGKFQTNITTKEITSLAKMQLDKMPNWTIKSISLNGSDGSDYTYSYRSGKLYVMIPDESSIDEAKDYIAKIMNNEKLESSYGEVSNVKDPGITQNNNSSSSNSNSSQSNNTSTDKKLTLSSTDITVKVGEKVTLVATNTSGSEVSWKSSNPNIATVSDSGEITPISAGVATITASISGETVSCIVRVIDPLDGILPTDPSNNDDKTDDKIDKEDNSNDSSNNELPDNDVDTEPDNSNDKTTEEDD